jgi:hypothetical protein
MAERNTSREFLRYGSGVDLTEPSNRIICDNCNKGIQKPYMHCSLCNNGNFDLCFECTILGIHCPGGQSHFMVRRSASATKHTGQDCDEDFWSRASGNQRDIVPLFQQLVETNNALYGLLLRNTPAHLDSPNVRNGVHEEIPNTATHGSANNIPPTLPSQAGPDQTSFPLESDITREQSYTMPTQLPEIQWLVPYGTYITGDGSGVLPGDNTTDPGPSSNTVMGNRSQAGRVYISRSEQGSRDQSASSKYVDLLLESEYLTDAETDQHKDMKRRVLEESKLITQIC